MKKVVIALVATVMMGMQSVSVAADAAAGKTKAAACAACHGAAGISATEMFPNLAGQKATYLAKQMKAFRDGTRKDPMMAAQAKPLSDADIDNISAYYAEMK